MLKQNTTSLTFNDIPQVMSEVLDELRFLKQEVEKINLQPKSKKARTPVSIERAAELTGLAKTTLYRYTAQGLIPCYKKGKCLMFYEDELETWMNSGRCITIEERIAETEDTILKLSTRAR